MALWRPVVSLFGARTRLRTRRGVRNIIKSGCPWLIKSRWIKSKNRKANSIPKREDEISVIRIKEKKKKRGLRLSARLLLQCIDCVDHVKLRFHFVIL